MNDVDYSQTITAVEWFFGYGGNHIGLKRVLRNLRLIAACEIEAYAAANMVAKMEAGLMDAAPVWANCKTFPIEQFRGLVDLFIASYPCQGFSSAGRREGQKDPRFLWPWVIRAVAVIQPGWVFFENVEGHVSLGLSTVISDLEAAGYKVEKGIFSAAECGAPQRRKRVFILAHRKLRRCDAGASPISKCEGGGALTDNASLRLAHPASVGARRLSKRPGRQDEAAIIADGRGEGGKLALAKCSERGTEAQGGVRSHGGESGREQGAGGIGECGDVGDPGRNERESSQGVGRASGQAQSCWETGEPNGSNGSIRPWHWPAFVARRGEEQHEWEPPRVIKTERGLGGGVNGRAANVDRLRLLGNGVYPATAARAFVTLYQELMR